MPYGGPAFTEGMLLDEVEDLVVQQQLEQVQQLVAQGLTTRQIWAHFAAPVKGKLRWATAAGTPIPLRTMQRIVAKVKARWREERVALREQSRRGNLIALDQVIHQGLVKGRLVPVLQALRLRAELDGSYVAAEEATQLGLYGRVLALAGRLEGYVVPEQAPQPAKGTPALWRFRLHRLEQLLLACDVSAARFRQLGEPPRPGPAGVAGTEARRRQYLAALNAEAAFQRTTFPGGTPESRFEAAQKAAMTGGMTSDNTVLGELAEEAEKATAGLK